MVTDAPRHIYLNDSPLNVSKWRMGEGDITFQVVTRGNKSADDIRELALSTPLTVHWDDVAEYQVHADITSHRTSGDGPTSVHVFHLRMWPLPPSAAQAASAPEMSLEEQIAQLRREVAELRQQIARLTQARTPSRASLFPSATGTLIEREIDTDDV